MRSNGIYIYRTIKISFFYINTTLLQNTYPIFEPIVQVYYIAIVTLK